ncbi:MAG: hypothetical protein WBA93_14620 [Microcoleaceae cyanobacterium]
MGTKGIGKLSVVGVGVGVGVVAAAIANAVYHATDKHLQDLPITPDKLLKSGIRKKVINRPLQKHRFGNGGVKVLSPFLEMSNR